MAGYLISVRPERWWRLEAWHDRGEVPADCVTDLRTSSNALSVFEVSDTREELEVMAALALEKAIGGRDRRQSLDGSTGLLFEPGLLDHLQIHASASNGRTKDVRVNARHRDLVELSGAKLASLALELSKACQPQTYYKPQLLRAVVTAVGEGRIAKTSIPDRVHEQLAEQGLAIS